MKIGFFGSSLVSSYWNGAATYYRGLLKELSMLGHDITFYEPDAYERQQHCDIPDPDWARVVVYAATADAWQAALEEAAPRSDLLVKASGIGVFDAELEQAVPQARRSDGICVYWDVDAPATLNAVASHPEHHLRKAIPQFDMVLTYGGGEPVIKGYEGFGANMCVPVYNALDPSTHFPVPKRSDLDCDLSFLGNRLPDREARVEEFFLKAASSLTNHRFLLGGSGWGDKSIPCNVSSLGHVRTTDHNVFFSSGLATMNINRDSMAQYGFSPPTRVFEAVGCGACFITDQWLGIEQFLEPGREVLVASQGEDVAEYVASLTQERATQISTAARSHLLAHHTYEQRARQVDELLGGVTLKAEAAE